MRRSGTALWMCLAGFLLAGSVLLSGCAAGLRDATVVSVPGEVDAALLRGEGLALVPVTLDAYEGDFRRDLAWELAGRIYHHRPDLRLQDLDRTARRIRDANLDRTVVTALDGFRRTGDAPVAELNRIAGALRVRFLLIVLWDQWLHYGSARGGRDEETEPARYEALTLIWDAGESRVAWEATGASVAEGTGGTAVLPDPARFVREAARGLAASLPS